MLKIDYIKDILDLEDVIITNIINTDEGKIITLELERKPQTCPQCHQESNKVHDYRLQKISDMGLHGKALQIILKKRRYSCPHCGKRFLEANHFLNAYQRRTNRYRRI